MKTCNPGCHAVCNHCKFMPRDDPYAGEGICQNPESPNYGKMTDWCADCDEFWCMNVKEDERRSG